MITTRDTMEDAITISALQHYSYCPRQCALIHIEQTFDENLYTLRGQAVHKQVEIPESRLEDGVRVERALPLYSKRLGLVGKADVVEFLSDGTPYPVEYKHGPRRAHVHDEIQLAAQAMCLEEMTARSVPKGAIYHHSSRRRREVLIGSDLRSEVERIIALIQSMLIAEKLPPPVNDARCQRCSLQDACQPEVVAATDRLQKMQVDLYRIEEDACDNS